MRRKRRWLKVIWFIVGGIVVLYWGGCFVMAQSYVSPIRLGAGERPNDFRDVRFDTGVYEIPAWRGGKGDDVFLLVHGYGGNQGYWNPLSRELSQHGEVVVLATMGQTISPAKEVGFGLGESEEILIVAEQLVSEGKRVHLVGVSQGGAASWIAAGSQPELFKSVTTEAAFARLDWASEEFLSVSMPRGHQVFRPIILIAERRKGIKGSEVRPVDFAKNWRGPCLIFQSKDDGMFTARHGESFADAVGGEVSWYSGLKHAEIFSERPFEAANAIMEMVRDVE